MDLPQEDRLVALESRLAHYERMTEDLSEVLARQDRTIDHLTAQVRRLVERLLTLESGAERGSADDRPPPHY